MGFVLADVSGKGVPAALLMANLQGSFRSQTSADPCAVMNHVNTLFYRSTPPEHFASAFLGVYDSRRQWLRFANCGHPPGLVIRSNGAVEKLETTACVLGVLEDLDSEEGGIALGLDDLVVLYSDGITEAGIEVGPEFGEGRLESILRDRRTAEVGGLIAGIAIGYFAKKVHSLPLGILFGLAVGMFLAFLIAMSPQPSGQHYYFEIMLPGSLLGAIVGLYLSAKRQQRELRLINLNIRLQDLFRITNLAAILQGHEEFLGLTPD